MPSVRVLKEYKAGNTIPNEKCPECQNAIRRGMPIYYVDNKYGNEYVDIHGNRLRSVCIHKNCKSLYDARG